MMYYVQQQELRNQNENKKQQQTTTPSTTSTTTRYTEPGVSCPDEVIERIAKAYAESISTEIPPMAARMMEQVLREGMKPDCLIAAINDTGWAQRPSPQYLRAILRRCREQGIKTIDQYRESQRKYTPVRSAWSANRFNYQQHTYTEEDFKDLFFDPTKDEK